MVAESTESSTPSAISLRRRAALKVPKAQYVDRRSTILQFAAETFRSRGVAATTMDDIARVSGLDRSSLYYYFSNKDELLQELLGELVSKSVENAEATTASSGSAAERLDRLIRDLVTSYTENYPALFVFVDEYILRRQLDDSDWAAQVRQWGRRYEAAIAAVIAEGASDGSLRDVGDARTVARAIVGMVNSMVSWYRPGSKNAKVAIAEILSGVVLDGVRN